MNHQRTGFILSPHQDGATVSAFKFDRRIKHLQHRRRVGTVSISGVGTTLSVLFRRTGIAVTSPKFGSYISSFRPLTSLISANLAMRSMSDARTQIKVSAPAMHELLRIVTSARRRKQFRTELQVLVTRRGDARKSSEAEREGLVAARNRVFLARMTCGHTACTTKRVANTHQLQKVLLYQCHNEFTDERPNAHLPERRLKRELPDHVLSPGAIQSFAPCPCTAS